jgi:hypothetical protein
VATLKILDEQSAWLPVVASLWQQMPDAPVFYSPSMLAVLSRVQPRKISVAVLLDEDATPLLAQPLFVDGVVQNAHYNGWDNLAVLKANCASEKDEQLFWNKLVTKYAPLKFECLAQEQAIKIGKTPLLLYNVIRRKCPFIQLGQNWDELNEVLGKKLVRNIRQYSNKAAAAGITFQVLKATEGNREALAANLRKAFSFHENRMEDINQQSKFTPETEQAYHENVLLQADNVFVIEAKNADGQLIAFYYGLLNKSRLAWFNGGYDTGYYSYSIGTLLVANLISFAYENGMHIFDFLRGNESYKQKWTSQFDQNYDIYMAPNSPIAKLKLTALYYKDQRKRIGTKNAVRSIFNQGLVK